MDKKYGWDDLSGMDFGWVVDFGYKFPALPGFTIGFITNVGIIDLAPTEVNYGGFVNQTNIHWGFWFGYAFWRKD